MPFTLTLRHFLYLTMAPMLILLLGAFYLTYQIQEHTDTLARNTVLNVLRAQRGAVDLEGLRILFKDTR
ncbi:hypothetical protein EVA_11700 [gut metagenome]|uniref:Uncharacterized protein n=1 Tax=gut metagenome TaxID=749906 RepID=J9CJF8_9ZZZZ